MPDRFDEFTLLNRALAASFLFFTSRWYIYTCFVSYLLRKSDFQFKELQLGLTRWSFFIWIWQELSVLQIWSFVSSHNPLLCFALICVCKCCARKLKGESALYAILSSHMERSYWTSKFFLCYAQQTVFLSVLAFSHALISSHACSCDWVVNAQQKKSVVFAPKQSRDTVTHHPLSK